MWFRASEVTGICLTLCLVTVMALAIWAPNVDAYEQYSTSVTAGNCADCHGDFRANGYISFKDGTAWGTSLHDGHRFTMLNSDCDTCHSPGGRFPVLLGDSSGGTGFPSISCVGCHGREADLNSGERGAGLRQHHNNAGAASCGGCHQDNDPATFTATGEDVPPPYYFTPDAAHPVKPTDPCNANGSESVFGPTGLDNDGDLLDDGADPDCAPPAAGPVFDDVPTEHFARQSIEALAANGVTAGCSVTPPLYCPESPVTREQMAIFLLKAKEGASFVPPACTSAPFGDVSCSSSFAPWIAELVARGITSGCGNGNYCPMASVTREQMAIFLLRALGVSPPACAAPTFSDVPCSSIFADWIEELVKRGITAGCGGSLYCPLNAVTRAPMAVFLVKTFALPF